MLSSAPSKKAGLSTCSNLTTEISGEESPFRCVTPSSSSVHRDYVSDESEEDIPHMLNPYSDNEDINDSNDENDLRDDHDNYIGTYPLKPISYRADSPQHWQLPLSNGYEIANSSPVSSISNFSCNTNVSIDSSGRRGNSNSKEQYVSSQNHHTIMEFPSSLTKATMQTNGISPPLLRPRMDKKKLGTPNSDHHHNIHVVPSSPGNSSGINKKVSKLRCPSPTNSQGIHSKSRPPSPTNSQGSRCSSHKNTVDCSRHVRKASRESRPDCLPPPSPRKGTNNSRTKKIKNHRRSVSLNQIPLSSSYSYILNTNGQQLGRINRGNSFDEAKSSPWHQNPKSLGTIGGHTTQINQNLNRAIPPKSQLVHSTHRRAVSFPDHVLQNGHTSASIGNISPLTLQSDDPALFSLLETTRSARNGRVYIPNDVDPSIFLPSMNTLKSISPIPMSRKANEKPKKGNTTTSSTTTESQNHPQSIIHPKKLESQSRHYTTKKHRRSKSGSGSFSSCENKLASLEEEGVFQSDDFEPATVGVKIDLAEEQAFGTSTEESGHRRRVKQHRQYKASNNTTIGGKQSTQNAPEYFLENYADNRRGFHMKNKTHSERRKESKVRNARNCGDVGNITPFNALKNRNPVLDKAYRKEMQFPPKNKDQCIIQ